MRIEHIVQARPVQDPHAIAAPAARQSAFQPEIVATGALSSTVAGAASGAAPALCDDCEVPVVAGACRSVGWGVAWSVGVEAGALAPAGPAADGADTPEKAGEAEGVDKVETRFCAAAANCWRLPYRPDESAAWSAAWPPLPVFMARTELRKADAAVTISGDSTFAWRDVARETLIWRLPAARGALVSASAVVDVALSSAASSFTEAGVFSETAAAAFFALRCSAGFRPLPPWPPSEGLSAAGKFPDPVEPSVNGDLSRLSSSIFIVVSPGFGNVTLRD